MKYPLSNEIYKILLNHKGEDKRIIGNQATIRLMREGSLNPTLKTVKTLLNDNDLPAEIVISIKFDGKKGKTRIKL